MIAAKGKGGHFALWLGLHPEDERRARDAARPFDWSTEWVRRVVGNALLLACLTRAGSLDLLTVEDLDAVEDAIADSAVLTRIGRVHLSAQYRGLRNLCYQLRVTDSPPVTTPMLWHRHNGQLSSSSPNSAGRQQQHQGHYPGQD